MAGKTLAKPTRQPRNCAKALRVGESAHVRFHEHFIGRRTMASGREGGNQLRGASPS
jgi:hypothetical protein